MVAKLATMTHKVATQLHLAAEAVTFAVPAPADQSVNFWINPCIYTHFPHRHSPHPDDRSSVHLWNVGTLQISYNFN